MTPEHRAKGRRPPGQKLTVARSDRLRLVLRILAATILVLVVVELTFALPALRAAWDDTFCSLANEPRGFDSELGQSSQRTAWLPPRTICTYTEGGHTVRVTHWPLSEGPHWLAAAVPLFFAFWVTLVVVMLSRARR
jgi:hypothetical protein